MKWQCLFLLETRRSGRLAEQRLKMDSSNHSSGVTSGLCRRGIHEALVPPGAPPPPPPPPALPSIHSSTARGVLKERNTKTVDQVGHSFTLHILRLEVFDNAFHNKYRSWYQCVVTHPNG